MKFRVKSTFMDEIPAIYSKKFPFPISRHEITTLQYTLLPVQSTMLFQALGFLYPYRYGSFSLFERF